MSEAVTRRGFLQVLGTVGVASAIPTVAVEPARAAADQQPVVTGGAEGAGAAAASDAYTFLMRPEAAFVEAAVARLIPADSLGAGAREAGVSYFVDRQLSGAFGTMGKNYREGPWREGTPEQGYQLALTPQELYRAGIAEANRHCERTYGKRFDELSTVQQDEVLKGLETGRIVFETLPAPAFFEMLYTNTVEGFFADPAYGGNRNKIGWKLIGFPGVAAVYVGTVENYNQPYTVEPVSISDVQSGQAKLDEHGHPIHRFIARHQQ